MGGRARFLTILFLLFAPCLHAQGQQITVGPFPVAGLVYVCPAPAGGTPCPSPSSIFSDSGLTQALSNPFSMPTQTIVTFYAAGGQYTIEMPASRVQQLVGGGGGGGGASKGSVDVTASPYNAKFDVHWGTIYTITNTSNAITACSDCNFTGTDVLGRPIAVVGQIVWATTMTVDTSSSGSVLATPECVISSIDSNTGIHMGTIGAPATPCNATSSTTGHLFWGDLDSASSTQVQSTANDPIFNAWTAAINNCAQTIFPVGATFIEQGEWITYNTSLVCNSGNSVNAERFGQSIRGQGRTQTFVFTTPNFKFPSCTGPNGTGATCILAFQNPNVYDITFSGGGNAACPAAASGKNLAGVLGNNVNFGSNALYKNVNFFGWCAVDVSHNTIGLNIGLSQTLSGSEYDDVWVENWGCNAISVNNGGGIIQWHFGEYWNGSGCDHVLKVGTGVFKSSLGYHCGNVGGNIFAACVTVATNASYYSTDDWLAPGGSVHVVNSTGGNVHFKGSIMNSGNNAVDCTGTCKIYLEDTTIGSGLIPFFAEAAATMSVYDGGNNTIVGGQAGGPGSLLWYGRGNGDTFHGACTGTATSSQTLGLYGTGPNVTATTCTSTTVGSGTVMQNTGTILYLLVTATHAGVSASSGVVTLLKNGSTQTMTCTIGTGTSCNDSTHTISYVPGDLISVQFTTQATEVLAGVNATVVAN